MITQIKYLFIFYLNYLLQADQHLSQAHDPPLGPKHRVDLAQIPGLRSRAFLSSTQTPQARVKLG